MGQLTRALRTRRTPQIVHRDRSTESSRQQHSPEPVACPEGSDGRWTRRGRPGAAVVIAFLQPLRGNLLIAFSQNVFHHQTGPEELAVVCLNDGNN